MILTLNKQRPCIVKMKEFKDVKTLLGCVLKTWWSVDLPDLGSSEEKFCWL